MSVILAHRRMSQRMAIACTAMLLAVCVQAQFAPVVGFQGTTAIPADSSAFVSWAKACSISRGLRDIAVPDSGYASLGDSSAAIGPATQNGVVSLGDGGVATLTFARPIINGTGFDFAVFENGFDAGGPGLAFLELAFVEVSSDGIHFVRFPATDNVQDSMQIALGAMDGSLLNNLAGKYTYGYGTPFDLEDLKDSADVDIDNITHVRVVDVVGTIDPRFGTRDSRGKIINDPYPTNFPSSGFDLDAVGVIHQKSMTDVAALQADDVVLFPNPGNGIIHVQGPSSFNAPYLITDISGREVLGGDIARNKIIDLSAFPAAVYFIKIGSSTGSVSKIFIKQ